MSQLQQIKRLRSEIAQLRQHLEPASNDRRSDIEHAPTPRPYWATMEDSLDTMEVELQSLMTLLDRAQKVQDSGYSASELERMRARAEELKGLIADARVGQDWGENAHRAQAVANGPDVTFAPPPKA